MKPKNTLTLKAGMIVKIYEDPITQKNLEGYAKLLECILEEPELSKWWVKFKHPDRSGFQVQTVIRSVAPPFIQYLPYPEQANEDL